MKMTASNLALPPLWRRLLWPGLLSAAALIVLLALGTWQVQRMKWKEALIINVNERLDAAPVELPTSDEWATLNSELYQYRRVRLSGRYLHQHQQLAYMVVTNPLGGPHGGQGFWIMTPFELTSGELVWINRGFVPNALAETDIVTGFEAETTLEGLMRAPEKAGFATPGNSEGFDGTIWFVRNPDAMTSEIKQDLAQTAPFFVDLDADETIALPQSGETRVYFENRHFGYVLTWYGIALTLVGVFVAFALREHKKSRV